MRTFDFGFLGSTHSNSKPPSSPMVGFSYWWTSYSLALYFTTPSSVLMVAVGSSSARIEKLTSLFHRITLNCGLKSGCLESPISTSMVSFGLSFTTRLSVLFLSSNPLTWSGGMWLYFTIVSCALSAAMSASVHPGTGANFSSAQDTG